LCRDLEFHGAYYQNLRQHSERSSRMLRWRHY
jgi:hypothetical protein